MKFSSAVDSLAKELNFLRKVVLIMAFVVMFLALAVLLLYEKAPVVVERSSRGLEIVRMTKLVRSEVDIQQAVRTMIAARFNSDAVNVSLFISNRQEELREAEQKEMKSRGLSQSVIFRKAQISKQEAIIEFDRILSFGEVRSGLKTIAKVAFEEVEPNELNPYGLKLSLVTQIERGKDEK